jgi:hypothetical protein
MMKMFQNPKVSSVVTVITDWADYLRPWGSSPKRQNTYTGTVVKSEKYDDPQSFRITTEDKSFPVRIISLDRVVSLVYADGSVGTKSAVKPVTVTAWEVKSDSRKGGTYTVTREGNHFSCTCAGYTFRKTCRHSIAIKSKVA